MLFGAFLQTTGAGKFLIDLSFCLCRTLSRRSCKSKRNSVCGNGLYIRQRYCEHRNHGVTYIPMMKQLGYTPSQAGGIEASASTGGQIMPPIMGAGAFIMAEFIIPLIARSFGCLYSGSLIFHFGSALCSLDGGQGWIRSRNIGSKRMDNAKGGYSFPVYL